MTFKLIYKCLSGLLVAIVFFSCNPSNQRNIKLVNEKFHIELTSAKDGTPALKHITVDGKAPIIFFADTSIVLDDWFNKKQKLFVNEHEVTEWYLDKEGDFNMATYEMQFSKSIKVRWVVKAHRFVPLIQQYVVLENVSERPIRLSEYPIWLNSMMLDSVSYLTYWDALTYQPMNTKVNSETTLHLHSKIYSSDNHLSDGKLPFWAIHKGHNIIYQELEWSGGWKTNFESINDALNIKTYLPEEEAGLSLSPDSSIQGPIMNTYIINERDANLARKNWLDYRRTFHYGQYPMPKSNFPLIYNHWYSVRFDLSSEFIQDQISSLHPYGFDVFVVDAGWYEQAGSWEPAVKKFTRKGFVNSMNAISENMIAGLWSCPQLITGNPKELSSQIDQPPFEVPFIGAYLRDYLNNDFETYLMNHVDKLINDYHMDWWKYDQPFFNEKDPTDRMQEVNALQNALVAVRKEYPNLIIENCMSGGRMINGFTDKISQIHWIKDGGNNGLEHALSNISEALGALELLHPYKVQRWTNRVNEIEDPDLLRFYCRSAMAGVWGISSDMSKVTLKQSQIIQQEIENYRKINNFKKNDLYQLLNFNNGIKGAAYYDDKGIALLLFRTILDTKMANIQLPYADHNANYKLNDVDGFIEINEIKGVDLLTDGLNIVFPDNYRSRIIIMKNKSSSE